MSTTAYLQFSTTGAPQDVLELLHREMPALGPHDVRVAMRYAPINPADLNFIEGNYGRPSNPPAVPGIEGSGEVVEIGSEVESLSVGDFVIPLHSGGTWTQQLVAPEGYFAKLPDRIDLVQASMLRINPVTAWRLLEDYAELAPGDWIVQNAANSGVGRALIQIARQRGIRTLNFVRRAIYEVNGKDPAKFKVDNYTPESAEAALAPLRTNWATGTGRKARRPARTPRPAPPTTAPSIPSRRPCCRTQSRSCRAPARWCPPSSA